MNVIEKLKKGALWSLAARGLGAVSGFYVTILLAKLMDVESLGIYFLLLLVARYAGHFLKFGLEISLQKLLSVNAASEDWVGLWDAVKNTLVILSITGCLVAIISSIIWPYIALTLLKSEPLYGLLFFFLLATFLRSMEEISSVFFRGVDEAKTGVFLVDVPRQLVFSCLLTFVYLEGSGLDLEKAIWFYIVSSLFSVGISFFLIVKWLFGMPINLSFVRPKKNSLKSLFVLSTPMMVHGVAALLISTTDVWLIGIFADKEDVGIYGAVVRLATLVSLILSVITMILPAMLASLYHQKKLDELQKVARYAANISLVIVVPLLLIFVLFGELILNSFFGEEYTRGYIWLILLSCGYSVSVAMGSPGWFLQMIGYERMLLKVTLFFALLNIFLGVFLINIFEVVGVPAASAITLLGLNISLAVLVYKKTGIKTWAGLIR